MLITDNGKYQASAVCVIGLEHEGVLCSSGDLEELYYSGEVDDLVLDEIDDIWY